MVLVIYMESLIFYYIKKSKNLKRVLYLMTELVIYMETYISIHILINTSIISTGTYISTHILIHVHL
jgi:hypothetical protein